MWISSTEKGIALIASWSATPCRDSAAGLRSAVERVDSLLQLVDEHPFAVRLQRCELDAALVGKQMQGLVISAKVVVP